MRLLLALSLVLSVLLPSSPAVAQTIDAVAMVQRYVAAVNAQDMATALSGFSDDATYAGGVGKEYLRTRLERDFSVNRRISSSKRSLLTFAMPWPRRGDGAESPSRWLPRTFRR